MSGIRNNSMRDSTGEMGGSLAAYVDTLSDNEKGNLNPSNPKHAVLLNSLATAIQAGQLDETRVQKLMRRNPNAAPVFAAAYDSYRSNPGIQRKQLLSQYFAPAREENIVTGGEDDQMVRFEQTPAKADTQGAILASLNRGDVELAKTLGFGGKSESPFAKIDPKDYTPESLQVFSKSGNTYDLIPRTKPEDLDRKGDRAFQQEEKLRGEFRGLSKDFLQVRDSYGRIQESAKNPSAAGDLALIFNYMKMLDPGSTVREGEFATAQNSAGIPDRIRAMYNKSISGERLADTTRADFVGRSKALYDRQRTTHKKLEAQYRNLSKSYGVDEKKVVTDFELEDMPNQETSIEKAIGGKTYVKRNGKWYEK